ncbi:hypothetical protein SAMN04487868_1425 [Marinobacter salarius]|mgnify:FL=1|jgi:hypothetical protein|uniref:Uncharacterized protein n=1 Tax=Marinobacter salarius TaxID=1420917 RepID=W5Z4V4_9GAMM|nr:hypothetical protein [Marinobacter salarius]AHI33498.1 hypothetical protein AU15_22245 [Marinobacter salarius]SFM15394.1 hypothetical protein SAMN04487868_1425 [Marinobacter salarius]|tara:strand:- start:1637 stop:2017 length:381 start_codon:yes stop_codon:yes gene_type:complete
MNLGNWDGGVLKAVLVASLIVPIYAVVEMGIPNSVDGLAGLGMFFLLFYSVYLLISIAGWVLVGFPAHWLICRFGGGRLVWYVIAVTMFTLAIYALAQFEAAIVFGLAALFQALLFKYYAYNHAKT